MVPHTLCLKVLSFLHYGQWSGHRLAHSFLCDHMSGIRLRGWWLLIDLGVCMDVRDTVLKM